MSIGLPSPTRSTRTRELALTLTIPAIDTVADRRPEDLRDPPWDNPIHLSEAGVPSNGCDGSHGVQARYIETLINVSDPRLERVTWVWMHDITITEVESYQDHYGVDYQCFARQLALLGLHTYGGVDKPAFTTLGNR